MTIDETPTIGFVGLGGWGSVQAEAIEELGGEIGQGADVNAKPRQQFEAQFGVDTVEDWEALDYDRLDGVIIGTPNAFHGPAAIDALENDVAAYVAKPMADSLDTAEAMIEAADQSDAWGMVGFPARYSTGVELFRSHHERGTFGDISHAEVQTIRRRGIPGMGSWFCSEELAGGGSLYDIGVHHIDRALYMLGFPTPTEATGVARTNFSDQETYVDPDNWNANWELTGEQLTVDDSTSAFVRFANGTTMSIEVAWAVNREPGSQTIIRGTDAGAKLGGDGDLSINTASSDGVDHYVDTTLRGELDRTGHHGVLSVFLEALREDRSPTTCTFAEGARTQEIMDAIYRSSREGQAIQLD